MATTYKTLFGDYMESISKDALNARIRWLTALFVEVVQKNQDLSGYFEAMLREMSSEAKAVLFLKLGRWLKNQSAEFHKQIETAYSDRTLLDDFEAALEQWAWVPLSSVECAAYPLPDVATESTGRAASRNAFGDVLPSIDEESWASRTRSLMRAFSDVLHHHPDLSGYFGAMLEEMSSEGKALLFLKLARWLKQQSAHIEDEINALQGDGRLLDVFEAALASWAQDLMLGIFARRSKIREVYPTELFPSLAAISVPIGVIHQESQHANHADMAYVCGIAGAANALRIFEFGTYRGQTTCGLASVCRDAQIHTLNLPPEADPRYAPYIGMFIADSPDRSRIRQIFCDSRTFDTEPYRDSMDYIFIDGDHSYEGVKNDTEKAMEMLKPGGIIVWHDYAAKSPGVLEYLAEFSQQYPMFRLRRTCLAVYIDGVVPEDAELAPMDASLEEHEYGSAR